MSGDTPTGIVITWEKLTQIQPNFVAWYVQRYGPIRDDDPGMTEQRWEYLRRAYERN